MTKSKNKSSLNFFKNRMKLSGGKSLSWRLILPVPIAIILCVAAIALIMPKIMADNVKEEAIRQGQQIANQFKTIRGYYTKNVIKKILKSGSLQPSVNHKNEANSVPLPATLIHDVSKLLAKKDMNVNLYSGFPWPNRKDRKLDKFQSDAWTYLSANPDKVYSRQGTRGGKQVIRVAVADKMIAQGCVSCHNSRAASPKTDWKLGDVRGVLEVSNVIEAQLAVGAAISNKMIIAAIIVGIILTFITIMGVRSVTGPLIRMTGAMKHLAEGDLETDIPGQNRQDEIGDMSGAVQVFKDNALRNKKLEKDQEEKSQVEKDRQDVISAATSEFDATISDIVNTVSSAATELNSTAQSMASISEETSTQAGSVATASELASTNVQTVASATEEMTASIGEINTQVAQASEISKTAVENVSKTSQQMDELAKTADKVGEVVSMISDIAEQTNLLALNATIESARAGEAGKGFAVVASEVKALANETAKATEEIAEHIQKIQTATKGAVVSIEDIGTVVKQLEQTSTAIAAAMEEQGSTTQEISRSVQEAATGTQEVNSSIAGVTQASQEAGAASGEVTSAAGELSQQAEKMKAEVEKFLTQVRAA